MTRSKILIASVSLGLSVIVLGLKYLAFAMTGSVALYSDALESVVNIATSAAALVSVYVAAHPADADHPYGHQKAEYISAVAVGVLIIVSALIIFREAFLGFMSPQPIEASLGGLGVSAGATALNAFWSAVLMRIGRRERSPALVADGKHLLADVVTSFGVIGGVAIVFLTGWVWMDATLAALVAVNVLWSGWWVVADSVAGLMDRAVPAAELARIREAISTNGSGAIEAHDLRTRQAGSRTFIDFHLVVPGETTVASAHDICDEIERSLRAAVGDALITIHVEPESKAKHSGIVVLT